MPKLTKTLVDNLNPRDHDYRVWDDKVAGFGVRVKPSGGRAYFVSYRTRSNKTRRYTIGRHDKIKPSDARKKAVQILAQVSLGQDPMADALEIRDVRTFRDLAEEYIARRGSEKVIDEDKRILKRDILPVLGDIPAKEVQRRTIVHLTDRIRDRGSPIMANRTLGLLKRIYSFGISRDVIEENPARDVKPTREKSRERVLSDKEIRIFWNRIDELPSGPLLKSAMKLILVTAQRPGEVAKAEWKEFDFDAGIWSIPGEKTKNRLPHTVPISSLAEEILSGIPRHDGQYVFPAKRGKAINSSTHMGVSALAAAVRRHRAVFELDRWSPHDLRRTAASGLASLGIPRLVVSKILNHKERGITGVYDRYAYQKEKRQGLEAWAKKIVSISEGQNGKVIPLVK